MFKALVNCVQDDLKIGKWCEVVVVYWFRRLFSNKMLASLNLGKLIKHNADTLPIQSESIDYTVNIAQKPSSKHKRRRHH